MCCQAHKLFASAKQKRVGGNKEQADPTLGNERKRCVDFAFTACIEDNKLQTERTCCTADNSQPNIRGGKARVHQYRNHGAWG